MKHPHIFLLESFVVRSLRVCLLILAATALAAPLAAQDVTAPKPTAGHITGTVTDVNDDTVPGAAIVLESPALGEPRKIVANDNGFFDLKDLDPGTYTLSVSAEGFDNWTSPAITVAPGQYVILTGTKLKVPELRLRFRSFILPKRLRPSRSSPRSSSASSGSSPISTSSMIAIQSLSPRNSSSSLP